MVSGMGSAIGISFPSPGVLIVLKLNSIEVDPQIIEILQSYYFKNTYDNSNAEKSNVLLHEKNYYTCVSFAYEKVDSSLGHSSVLSVELKIGVSPSSPTNHFWEKYSFIFKDLPNFTKVAKSS